MFINKKIQRSLLALFLVIGLGLSSSWANQNDGDNIMPIICVPDTLFRLYVNSVITQPGIDTVEVAIDIDYWESVIMSELVFNLEIDEGIEYVRCEANDWEGDIFDTCYTAERQVEIQCHNDTLSLALTRSPVILVFTLDDGVGFDSTMYLSFTGTVYFKFLGDPLAYDPLTGDGYVRTCDDDVTVDIGETNGYSYQAFDNSSSFKSSFFVEVPINYEASFSADYYVFHIVVYPTTDWESYPYRLVGYDTTNATYGAKAVMITPQLLKIYNLDSTYVPMNTNTTLITLWYQIEDFTEEYNTELDYSNLISVPPAGGSCQRYVRYYNPDQEDPDINVPLVIGTNFFGGSITLPEYQATFDIINATVDINQHVALPIELEPTFYAQFYENYLEFNSDDLHCDSITAGADSVPQDVDLTYIDTLRDYHTIRITATNLEDDEYISPDTGTVIYYVHFTADEGFDSTVVDFSENWYEGKVLDYFPPESWGESGHISRMYGDGAPYYETLNGKIYNYGVQPAAPLQPQQTDQESPGIVSIDEVGPIPFAFALEQNYPNPFNATTNISFSLAETGPVQIEIYDILGQRVRTLIAKDLNPGPHHVVWNGNNNYGKPVSSGCYFYILTAKNFRQSKQMILLK